MRWKYKLFHFSEQIEANEILFDYALQEGPASTRNAIKLLGLLGFDQNLIDKAEDRASRYLADGVWLN